MKKEYHNTFNLGSQSLHFISNESNSRLGTENPPNISFGMATKNRSITVIQKKRGNSDCDVDEENWENFPPFNKSIKGNNNII